MKKMQIHSCLTLNLCLTALSNQANLVQILVQISCLYNIENIYEMSAGTKSKTDKNS